MCHGSRLPGTPRREPNPGQELFEIPLEHTTPQGGARHGGCSGSEAGSYCRLIDFAYHSTLGLRVTKKKKKKVEEFGAHQGTVETPSGGRTGVPRS